MDEQLIAYVQEQRKNGFSDEQIAQALRQQNYPESLIKPLLAHKEAQASPGLLKTYIETYRQQGYSEDQIRAGLSAQGFKEHDIDKALHKPTEKKFRPMLFIFPLLAILILGGGYFLIINIDTTPPFPENAYLRDISEEFLPYAKENPEKALEVCQRLVPQDRDRCVFTVGSQASDPSMCRQISTGVYRDQCFLEFIYVGHTEYCPELTQEGNKQYCSAINA